MGLRMWFPDEVICLLSGVQLAANHGLNVGVHSRESEEYRQGYNDALEAVATAFGVRITDNGHREPKRLREWT